MHKLNITHKALLIEVGRSSLDRDFLYFYRSDDKGKKAKKKRRLLWQNGVSTQDITPIVVDRSIVQSCQFGKGKNKEEPGTNTKVSCCYLLHVFSIFLSVLSIYEYLCPNRCFCIYMYIVFACRVTVAVLFVNLTLENNS